MKKVMKCIGMVALVALAFTSCKKQEEKSVISVSSEELITISDDRAYLNDAARKPYFEVGDKIMVFNISKAVPTQSNCAVYGCTDEGDNVPFENLGYGDAAQDALDAGYYAFYPFEEPNENIITELNQGENKSKFRVDAEQTYRPDKVSLGDLYMAGHSNAANLTTAVASFHMENIMGVLCLKPYEAAQRTVTQIEIVDNHFHLSGWVELIIPEVNATELKALFNSYSETQAWMDRANAIKNRIGYNVTEAGYSITLNVPDGVQLGTNKDNTPDFNIVLRPLALSQGFHVIFTFSDGSIKDVDLSSYHGICIAPNVRRDQGLNLDRF